MNFNAAKLPPKDITVKIAEWPVNCYSACTQIFVFKLLRDAQAMFRDPRCVVSYAHCKTAFGREYMEC